MIATRRQGRHSGPMLVAVAGAGAQVVGHDQVWDAWAHLHLSHGGPVAWMVMALGPLVVIVALVVDRGRDRKVGQDGARRRAA